MTTPLEPPLSPVAAHDRIEALDVLRGFALLGILIMNIRAFMMPIAAYFFPLVHGDLGGANFWIWYLAELLAANKFITLFSMLFGAGVALMHARATALHRGWAGLHYRRLGVLLLIGVAHAYLLWDGDILVSYALSGLVLFLFRKVRPGRLLIASLIFLMIGSGVSLLAGLSAPHWPPEDLAEFEGVWQPTEDDLAEEIAAKRGGWIGEVVFRAPRVLQFHTFIIPFFVLWRTVGCMLLGMALFKWGWLSGAASRRLYIVLIALGLLIGLPLTIIGLRLQMASGWDPIYAFFLANQYPYWGSIFIALAYVGVVALMLRANAWAGLTARLAAVGRMAFTNYLMQTVLCTTLAYGRGFGLFGQVDRVTQLAIVLAVWVVQLFYSRIWLRHFRFGPAEWLWRSLAYRSRQPMRRQTS